jgi:hypothetical protein
MCMVGKEDTQMTHFGHTELCPQGCEVNSSLILAMPG